MLHGYYYGLVKTAKNGLNGLNGQNNQNGQNGQNDQYINKVSKVFTKLRGHMVRKFLDTRYSCKIRLTTIWR